MTRTAKIGVVVGLLVVVGVVLAMKERGAPIESSPASASAADIPRLLEVGSVTCVPCQMMAPILEALRQEYAGRLQVDFIDVRERQDAMRGYRVRAIPTQIFFDASGKELFRHEGFFAKEDILTKWKELGVDLNAGEPAASEPARTGAK